MVNTGPARQDDLEGAENSFYSTSTCFWGDLHTPDGIERILEVMSRGITLTCVTDGSYIRHLAPNISGAGWIISTGQADGHEDERVAGEVVELGRQLQGRNAGDAGSPGLSDGSRRVFPQERHGR